MRWPGDFSGVFKVVRRRKLIEFFAFSVFNRASWLQGSGVQDYSVLFTCSKVLAGRVIVSP